MYRLLYHFWCRKEKLPTVNFVAGTNLQQEHFGSNHCFRCPCVWRTRKHTTLWWDHLHTWNKRTMHRDTTNRLEFSRSFLYRDLTPKIQTVQDAVLQVTITAPHRCRRCPWLSNTPNSVLTLCMLQTKIKPVFLFNTGRNLLSHNLELCHCGNWHNFKKANLPGWWKPVAFSSHLQKCIVPQTDVYHAWKLSMNWHLCQLNLPAQINQSERL